MFLLLPFYEIKILCQFKHEKQFNSINAVLLFFVEFSLHHKKCFIQFFSVRSAAVAKNHQLGLLENGFHGGHNGDQSNQWRDGEGQTRVFAQFQKKSTGDVEQPPNCF